MNVVLGADDPDFTDLQAQFSLAYVSAVASVAGFYAEPQGRGSDKDGVDITILRRGPFGMSRSPRIDVQVKSEGRGLPASDPFSYALKAKNFHDLCRDGYLSPRILVLVLVPENAVDWTRHSEAELVLRHCGYWMSLLGQPELPPSQTKKTIHIPRSQAFTPLALTGLMQRASDGDLL